MKKRQIHARLIEQGTNFRRWALEHGYQPRTVTQVVSRWAGRNEQPRGRLSFHILQALSQAVGSEIVPGAMEHVEQSLDNPQEVTT